MPTPKKLPATSLAELIHNLGLRSETADYLQINPRTLTTRMSDPSTFTVGELQKLAEKAGLDLLTVTALAEHQIKNPVQPPAPKLGRPVRKH